MPSLTASLILIFSVVLYYRVISAGVDAAEYKGNRQKQAFHKPQFFTNIIISLCRGDFSLIKNFSELLNIFIKLIIKRLCVFCWVCVEAEKVKIIFMLSFCEVKT